MRAFVLSLAAALVFASPAAADRFSLTYDGVGLGFLPIGGVTIDANVEQQSYDVAASLQSGGILNLFERTRLRATASGVIVNDSVYWRRYELDHHYSRKHRTITMQVGEEGTVVAEIVPNYRLWGEPPANEDQRRQSRDPLSTVVAMAIDVGQTRRCSGAYPVFDGRFYYLLELGGGEVDNFRGGGYEGEILRCSLAYIAVAGFEEGDQGRRRIPQGQVWFALMPDTRFAPPVRIATPLSAGGATIRLASFRRARVEVTTVATSP